VNVATDAKGLRGTNIAAYGKESLALAADCLLSSNPDVVKTAIAAIGQVRTQKASEILYQYLVPEFEQLEKTRRWQRQIPAEDPGWQPLAIAIWEGAIAIEDCTLLKLEKNGIVNLIAHHPQIVLEFCGYLSQRLRETERYPFADNLL
jgi:hypothetical protein